MGGGAGRLGLRRCWGMGPSRPTGWLGALPNIAPSSGLVWRSTQTCRSTARQIALSFSSFIAKASLGTGVSSFSHDFHHPKRPRQGRGGSRQQSAF